MFKAKSNCIKDSSPIEAIISPEVFDLVQAELEKRKRKSGSRYSGVSIFSNKIKCGDCGSWYSSKVWHSTDQYRKVIYRCNHKYGDEKCQTPHITEEEIKEIFVTAFNKLLIEKKEIIANVVLMRKTLFDTSDLTAERDALKEEMQMLVDRIQSCIAENARVAQDQEVYQKRYNGLADRYESAKKCYDEMVYAIEQKEAQGHKIQMFIQNLKKQNDIVTEFDDALWGSMVDFITIGRDYRTVTFKDGTEISV